MFSRKPREPVVVDPTPLEDQAGEALALAGYALDAIKYRETDIRVAALNMEQIALDCLDAAEEYDELATQCLAEFYRLTAIADNLADCQV